MLTYAILLRTLLNSVSILQMRTLAHRQAKWFAQSQTENGGIRQANSRVCLLNYYSTVLIIYLPVGVQDLIHAKDQGLCTISHFPSFSEWKLSEICMFLPLMYFSSSIFSTSVCSVDYSVIYSMNNEYPYICSSAYIQHVIATYENAVTGFIFMRIFNWWKGTSTISFDYFPQTSLRYHLS